MKQKIFVNKSHGFETETRRSGFDKLFESNNIVDKRNHEEMKGIFK